MDEMHGAYARFSEHDEWVKLWPPVKAGSVELNLEPGETLQEGMDRMHREEILSRFKTDLFPGKAPLKSRDIISDKLSLCLSRDDITETQIDIMAYVREEIRRQLGPEARIINLYWGDEDFTSDVLHLKVGVEAPVDVRDLRDETVVHVIAEVPEEI